MHDVPHDNKRQAGTDRARAREARRTRAMFQTTYEELGKMKRAEAVFGGLSREQARAMLEDALWRTDQAARRAVGEEPEA
ncbi:MAG TPA: hypothetical protein VGW38_24690 [Chloroflexota bacterium]|nr:hypothetical protein [Chloroflexota bacterium]